MLNFVGTPLTRMLGYAPGWSGFGEDLPKGVFLQWVELGHQQALHVRRSRPQDGRELRRTIAARCARCAFPTIPGRHRRRSSCFAADLSRRGRDPDRRSRRTPASAKIGHFGFFRPSTATRSGEAAAEWMEATGNRPTEVYSAASRTWRAVGVRMVTSSSAAVGCSAMVASKSALVAFILMAMRDQLHHFGRAVADDVTADHAVGRRHRRRASSGPGCRGPTSSPSSAGSWPCRCRRD